MPMVVIETLEMLRALTALLIFLTQLPASWVPAFEPIQADLFAATGGQANAWADVDNDGDLDYDGDGDLDLFAAFRDVPNRLLRNDRGRFVDVTDASGIGDRRKTVSAVWWDFDRDGDLDLFTANQEGEANGLFRQDKGRFEDVAAALGVSGMPRPAADGGVGASVADYDLDGDVDLFVANYGHSELFRNDGGKGFTEISR